MRWFSGMTLKPHQMLAEIVKPFEIFSRALSNFIDDQHESAQLKRLVIDHKKNEIATHETEIEEHLNAAQMAASIRGNIHTLLGSIPGAGDKAA